MNIIDIHVPDLGTDEVEVTEILVKVGDLVQVEQSIMVVEGDKASIEIPSPFSGMVKDIKVNCGDKVNTGDVIMTFEVNDYKSENNKELTSLPAQNKKITNNHEVEHIYATPTIRRLAREFNINLSKINGTGRKGRILREDLDLYLKEKEILNKVENSSTNKIYNLPWPSENFRKYGEIEEIKLGKIQQISGSNLYRNWLMIPHVTQFDEVDITELEKFRQNYKQELRITLPIFIIKAVAKALEKFPLFNSSLSENKKTVFLKKYINIGLAVNTSNGLVVPVLRDIPNKGIIKLTNEVIEIVNKARKNLLSPKDLQGGCFTISSLGGIGGKYFTPIINAPEVAILGVSTTSFKPIWNGKKFIPKLILPLSLSYDHRIINGVDGVYFLNYIKKILSDIRYLIM